MKKNSGQVAVFVLLVMLLGLSVGLSVMSRTLQDLKSTTTSDQSSRAFTAAEAGIEAALNTNSSGSVTVNNIPVTYTVTPQSANSYSTSGAIGKDDVAQIDLGTNYPAGNTINIYWSSRDNVSEIPSCDTVTPDNSPAALEVSLYIYNSVAGTYSMKKYAYNPAGCAIDDSFTSSTSGPIGTGGFYSQVTTLSVDQYTRFVRFRPLYHAATIKVTGTSFPSQASQITSYATTSGQVSRAVQITKVNSSLPPIFDYVLFGGSGNVSQ